MCQKLKTNIFTGKFYTLYTKEIFHISKENNGTHALSLIILKSKKQIILTVDKGSYWPKNVPVLELFDFQNKKKLKKIILYLVYSKNVYVNVIENVIHSLHPLKM